ncbi:hypothetical protein GGQ08_003231 [Salinibacter ruber]|nr:GIY-YIG nuclease family protein [Salinibacter ruber]MCS3655140.1 hypothetical protein [Salinibacter ruber]
MSESLVAVLYLGVIILNGRIARDKNISVSKTIFASFFLSYFVTIYIITIKKDKTSYAYVEGRTSKWPELSDKSGSRGKAASVGSVYVLKNAALPDVVKIGHTTRSAEVRARELSGTGVPGKWQVAHEISVARSRLRRPSTRNSHARKFRTGESSLR